VRKLVGEATTFALLGFLCLTSGLFAKLEIDAKAAAKLGAARAVHAVQAIDPSYVPGAQPGTLILPSDTVDVPLTNGTVLHVRQCSDNGPLENPFRFEPDKNYVTISNRDVLKELNEVANCRTFAHPFRELADERFFSVPMDHPEQVAIEKDYWAAYRETQRAYVTGYAAGLTLLIGLWGFHGGIGIWAFYRLVRFAIKG
jgi:hypothetical protein